MKKVIIDPSIATVLELLPIGEKEERPIIFTAAESWPGTYTLSVWNSAAKNTEYEMPEDAISTQDTVLTWWIKPTTQDMPAGKYYAEIFSNEFSSIIYKANFEILK